MGNVGVRYIAVSCGWCRVLFIPELWLLELSAATHSGLDACFISPRCRALYLYGSWRVYIDVLRGVKRNTPHGTDRSLTRVNETLASARQGLFARRVFRKSGHYPVLL